MLIISQGNGPIPLKSLPTPKQRLHRIGKLVLSISQSKDLPPPTSLPSPKQRSRRINESSSHTVDALHQFMGNAFLDNTERTIKVNDTLLQPEETKMVLSTLPPKKQSLSTRH